MERFNYNQDKKIWTYQDETKKIRYSTDEKRIVKQALRLEDKVKVLNKTIKIMFRPQYKAFMEKDYSDTISHPNMDNIDLNSLTISGLIFSYNNLNAQVILASGGRSKVFGFYTNLEFMGQVLNDKAYGHKMIMDAKYEYTNGQVLFSKRLDENLRSAELNMPSNNNNNNNNNNSNYSGTQ